MPTLLTKPLTRKLRQTCAAKNGRGCTARDAGARPVIIQLDTDEMIRFRVSGTRTVYSIHCLIAFEHAKAMKSVEDYEEKMNNYRIRKGAGLRVKKPKKPFIRIKTQY